MEEKLLMTLVASRRRIAHTADRVRDHESGYVFNTLQTGMKKCNVA
jgi:hypothetical protein